MTDMSSDGGTDILQRLPVERLSSAYAPAAASPSGIG